MTFKGSKGLKVFLTKHGHVLFWQSSRQQSLQLLPGGFTAANASVKEVANVLSLDASAYKCKKINELCLSRALC